MSEHTAEQQVPAGCDSVECAAYIQVFRVFACDIIRGFQEQEVERFYLRATLICSFVQLDLGFVEHKMKYCYGIKGY